MPTVYVLNKDGKPLMPTTRCMHVRHLLKNGKARVVKWTIKEMNLILAHSIPDRQLSARLQRSVQSIQVMRCRLRSK